MIGRSSPAWFTRSMYITQQRNNENQYPFGGDDGNQRQGASLPARGIYTRQQLIGQVTVAGAGTLTQTSLKNQATGGTMFSGMSMDASTTGWKRIVGETLANVANGDHLGEDDAGVADELLVQSILALPVGTIRNISCVFHGYYK